MTFLKTLRITPVKAVAGTYKSYLVLLCLSIKSGALLCSNLTRLLSILWLHYGMYTLPTPVPGRLASELHLRPHGGSMLYCFAYFPRPPKGPIRMPKVFWGGYSLSARQAFPFFWAEYPCEVIRVCIQYIHKGPDPGPQLGSCSLSSTLYIHFSSLCYWFRRYYFH